MKGIKFLIIGMILLFSFNLVSSQSSDFNVCCERTNDGAWCQNSVQNECDGDYRISPTNCDATSYCALGTCVDSEEGLCMDNTPQKTCEIDEGTWIKNDGDEIPQCSLGCCLIGDQASFVTLTRCKRLSNIYGLETNYRRDITNEAECIAVANFADKGACVFESEGERSCKFTTREDCVGTQALTAGNGTELKEKVGFFKDFLCSADELATNCGPTTQTTCVDGKEEVYFRDSCGNPANIYDANKIYSKDASYWQKIVSKTNSCGFGASDGNADSATCGNCEYFQGSICGKGQATHGDLVCKDVNCYNTANGNNYKNGESWCVFQTDTGEGRDPVGSRHFRHVCINGEETIEPCADFRNEACLQEDLETSDGVFTEAACRVNRWTDCVDQTNKESCENTDKRDCYWKPGFQSVGQGYVIGGAGACVPQVPPGLKHWAEEEANSVCALANSRCEVTYEEGLVDFLGGEKECVDNCHCLEPSYLASMNDICTTLGDCGNGVNVVGASTSYGSSVVQIED